MGIYDTQTIPAAPAKPTLLIVDDEAGPRESLRIVFKDRYHCAVASSGLEGVEYAKNNRVDAAILDIKMPDISGVEVLRQLKEMDPDIECVMLTGYETVDSARAAIRYGAADYLNKPFDVFRVRDLLEKCIARRQGKTAAAATIANLQRANTELSHDLAESQRLATVNVLSAGVVHEMNNPLAVIAGYAELLNHDLATLNSNSMPDVQQRLAKIRREVDRCKDIARRFLDFARTKERIVESLSVVQLLQDAVALVRAHPANRGAQLMVDVADPRLTVNVHATEFLQILLNLSINSLHAMKGQGQLTLGAARVASVTEACRFCAPKFSPANPHVRVTVTDMGCGIPAALLPRLFEPYVTTKTDGTGLGLAVTAELMARYDGAVGVASEVGQGSVFSLYLPVRN